MELVRMSTISNCKNTIDLLLWWWWWWWLSLLPRGVINILSDVIWGHSLNCDSLFQPLVLETRPVVTPGRGISPSQIQKPYISPTLSKTQTRDDGNSSLQCITTVNCGWLHMVTPQNLWWTMTNWWVSFCTTHLHQINFGDSTENVLRWSGDRLDDSAICNQIYGKLYEEVCLLKLRTDYCYRCVNRLQEPSHNFVNKSQCLST